MIRFNLGSGWPQPKPIALAFAIVLAWSVPGWPGESPVLQLDRSEIDLGQLIRGQTGQATFVLSNGGSAPLEILEVEPGCRCTVVDFDRIIAPGGSGALVASLETDDLHGKQARWVKVRTNDPMNPEVRLVLIGEVVGSVNLFPRDKARLSDRTPGGDTATMLIRKEESESGVLEIADVQPGEPWLKVRATRLDERVRVAPGTPMPSVGDWRLDLSIGDDAPYGWSVTEVTLKTGLPRQPSIVIPVRVERAPPVDLSKNVVQLPATGPFEDAVLVSVRSTLDPTLLEVETEAGGVDLQLEPAGGSHYRLKVLWNGKKFPKSPIVFVLGDERLEVPFERAGKS